MSTLRPACFAAWYEPADLRSTPTRKSSCSNTVRKTRSLRTTTRPETAPAYRFSDFLTSDELHDTYLYQELYRPMGMEYQMSVTLQVQAPRLFALVLGDDCHDFSERDRTVLNRIRPHLTQMWHNVRDLDRLRALVGAAREVSLDQGWGVITLWDTPEELTPGAFVTLYRHFGKPTRALALPGPGRTLARRAAGSGAARRRPHLAAPALGPGRRPADHPALPPRREHPSRRHHDRRTGGYRRARVWNHFASRSARRR